MIDPIGAHGKIADSLVSYIQTAFGTRFPSLEAEREALLRRPGSISQEPWIEPLPRYESSGKRVADLTDADLPGLPDGSAADFRELAACGLVGEYPLHRHQVEMLTKALEGNDCVITAGTGSGKTESFLLPLFAYLAHESSTWSAPGPPPDHLNDWWASDDWRNQCQPRVGNRRRWTRTLRVPQRGHETRPAAARALVVYPMNALVEDQLSRMRRALDSVAARTWLAENRGGNRIYVGRYTGLTPVPGHEYRPPTEQGGGGPDGNRIERLTTALLAADEAAQIAAEHERQPGNEDVRYFFPRLDGAEMRSRWDMQDAPPDILITNFSMLSIMLMRDADAPIFQKTRQWLTREGSVFHLIVDELHLYRGTSGTEVAYLLRLLLDRLGLEPSSPKLRVLASSASLEPEDPESLTFLSEFFGTEWHPGQIVPGYPAALDPPPPEPLDPEPFADLAAALDAGDQHGISDAQDAAASALGATAAADPQQRLAGAVAAAAADLAPRLVDACVAGNELRAVPLSTFATNVFGAAPSAELAARGVLYARALSDAGSLPAFRLHWFFKGVEGLWACTSPSCSGRHEGGDGRTAGPLYLDSRVLCDAPTQHHRVLELLYCEQCGTTLFGGSRTPIPDGGGWELLTSDPDIEGIPDRQAARFLERRTWGDFAVFWPSGDRSLHADARGTWNQPALTPGTVTASWAQAVLDPTSGRVQFGGGPGPVEGHLFHLSGELRPPECQCAPIRLPCLRPRLCSAAVPEIADPGVPDWFLQGDAAPVQGTLLPTAGTARRCPQAGAFLRQPGGGSVAG